MVPASLSLPRADEDLLVHKLCQALLGAFGAVVFWVRKVPMAER